MRFYRSVYSGLGFPDAALKVALGKIVLKPAATIPFISDGFPPALIPLWSDDFGYYGFWRHWFTSRHVSIVRVDKDEHYVASEVARSFPQFAILMVGELLCAGGNPDSRCRQLLLDCGLEEDDFTELLGIVDHTGDDPSGFRGHRRFRDDVPLACFDDPTDYPGDFPLPDQPGQDLRQDTCGFEFSLEALGDLAESSHAPWLFPSGGVRRQPELFAEFLRKGELRSAWMSLNSPAWTADEARIALQHLAEQANDADLALVASAWISERQGVLS